MTVSSLAALDNNGYDEKSADSTITEIYRLILLFKSGKASRSS